MEEAFDQLRETVRRWYREEAAKLAAAFAADGDLDKLDFGELIRRSQVVFACEMVELTREQPRPVLEAEDQRQLERVAAAFRARGDEVPESIRRALGEE